MNRFALICLSILLFGGMLLPTTSQAQYRDDDCDDRYEDRRDRRDHRHDRRRYRAAPSNTSGFFLQGHVSGAGLGIESAEVGGGSGLGLKIGYAPSDLLTLYVGLDGAVLENDEPFLPETRFEDELGLVVADLGAQFNFGGGKRRTVPYVGLALSAVAAVYDTDNYDRDRFDRDRFDDEPDVTLAGGGLSIGGGLRYFMSPTVALDGGLTFTGVNFSELEIDGQNFDTDFDGGTVRLTFGIAWYPTR